ncbi:MAG: 4'-phosphopantetheinyl transferase superfamily protein [Clostridia bacterium]|nr:4'-phosphopantetheinyl transferase superfamily protein [Clostridia bacterium]
MEAKISIIGQKTVIYAEKIQKYYDKDYFLRRYNSLPVYRREKIDALKRAANKYQSLCAEMLLRKALKNAGYDPDELTVSFGPHGKGYFKEIKEKFNYNISHSGEYVICAVNHGPEEIGCDIEKIREIDPKTPERFFTENECKMINRSKTESERTRTFFRIWTLKESFIKATGYGFSLPFKSFETEINGKTSAVRQNVTPKSYILGTRFTRDGYVVSWCSETKSDGAGSCPY